MIADRPLWIAASTNKGEEEQIIYVHQKLKESHDKILTVIAPRHPERAGDIKKLFTEKGFNVSLRSKSEEITDKTEIYIADTIGEMGIFYRLTGIVFMGGSLVEHGGQNPLEAARLECAIISGNNVDNFRDMYSELEEAGGVVIIKDASELVTKIEELLADHDKQENLAKNAYDFIESKAGILDDYIENLSPYLNPLNKNSISNNSS
jgi:3-deoxy-D-manno-octulosonic-acid transferase